MNADDYTFNMRNAEMVIQQASLFADHITVEDLATMRETLARADSIGPIVDPTKYRDALQDGRLEYQREVIDLVTHIKAKLAKLREMKGAKV